MLKTSKEEQDKQIKKFLIDVANFESIIGELKSRLSE
jgi:hypothetical protein